MNLSYRNEIIKLLNNLSLSVYLECPKLCSNDEQAEIALSSLYMLLKRNDYPTHYDKNSNGCFVPDIVTYQCPPIYSSFIKDSSPESIMAYESSMQQHIIGIEHFKFGNFSYSKKKKNTIKIVNKLSEFEANLYKSNEKITEQIIDLDSFKIKGRESVFTSFECIYKQHYSKMAKYQSKIQEDNLLGHAIHPDGQRNYVPIWFLIECDDCLFINNHNEEIPIFLTKEGKNIIDKIGIPDGLIYYGRNAIFAFSKIFLNRMPAEKCVTTYPEIQQYIRFKKNEWRKHLLTYDKII